MTSFQAALPGKPTQMSPNRAADPDDFADSDAALRSKEIEMFAVLYSPTGSVELAVNDYPRLLLRR